MSSTDTEQEREQAAEEAQDGKGAGKETVAHLMPALAVLDKLGGEVEAAKAAGEVPDPGTAAAYRVQTDHASHLLNASGLDVGGVRDAEREHRSAGATGYAARALDHIHHPRDVDAPTQQAEQCHGRERDEEQEIEL
ncbi:hypothetical protein [Streptomyces synnematoformans]|uniref:Uncharacterized protein n=1 Tax=Streptomyces synnematoformans TaxID=415721 RepID=A0ABN2XID7_9ACTN